MPLLIKNDLFTAVHSRTKGLLAHFIALFCIFFSQSLMSIPQKYERGEKVEPIVKYFVENGITFHEWTE